MVTEKDVEEFKGERVEEERKQENQGSLQKHSTNTILILKLNRATGCGNNTNSCLWKSK